MSIGINCYQNDRVPALKYCANDARALHDFLVKSQASGYARSAHLLVDDLAAGGAATRLNTLKKLQGIANQAHPDDMLLFYFAGHGRAVGQELYLLPTDVEPDEMTADTAIPLSRIKQILESSAARMPLSLMPAMPIPPRSAILPTRWVASKAV
ncbi:MAG: caspase family protein [Anaerolineales bacterium]|nr:caspase family protein [Anaerolineales bacterium]